MQCCNRTVTTPFCPYCGQSCHGTPLHTLLDHVTQHATELRERHAERLRVGDVPEGKRMQRLDITACKWEGWRDALSRLIAEKEGYLP